MSKLKLRRDGAQAWLLSEPESGADVGGIRYEHAADGNHYRTWLMVEGVAHDFGVPLPQLAIAARAVNDEATRMNGLLVQAPDTVDKTLQPKRS